MTEKCQNDMRHRHTFARNTNRIYTIDCRHHFVHREIANIERDAINSVLCALHVKHYDFYAVRHLFIVAVSSIVSLFRSSEN